MGEQAAAGWYPDGYGNERYWDGSAWTEQLRQPEATSPSDGSDTSSKDGAFSKIGAAVKKVAAEKKAAKEELGRKQALDAEAAGGLVTSGVFGNSTVQIYDEGYVRVASWPGSASVSTAAPVTKDTPYEKLRSIKFQGPAESEASGSGSSLEDAVGPAVANLIKGGRGLMKASAPGLAAAGIARIAGAEGRKAFLTIATDKQIHTLTNQTSRMSNNKGHLDVGLALEDAGNSVLQALGLRPAEPTFEGQPPAELNSVSQPEIATVTPRSPGSGLAERLRELAELHKEGILSDEEFASAKAKLLGNL